ncbi:acireductone synthase [Marinobacter fonticola]|uniref:acireductone synthase n=1 Tax=Marinobacter fonticola TaxID=2603215 RepID=UPI0011E7BD08|nr:acireductone synthase [Marinobacter fonticola]
MIGVILTDIEGTTSSISFVHDVLFPYAAEHMADFVRQQAPDNEAVQVQLKAVADESGGDPSDLEGLVDTLLTWIREDRKATPLKALQGMIWEKGYRDGDFKGHVYQDAADKLREWHDRGLRQYVYSSGSVQAQKLIFGFSSCGNLTPFFSGYFDTHVGAKREAKAYRNILDELGLGTEPETVLFLSDITQELDAAAEAGMETILLVRGEESVKTGYPIAHDFNEVDALLAEID